MRIARKVFAALAILVIGFATPGFAGVPKVVFTEEFGATW